MSEGKISRNPAEINEAFKNYYSELYAAQPNDDMSVIDSFLSPLNLPHLSNEDSEAISRPFSLSELSKAIKSLPSDKSPREDGFPPKLFKKFKDLLMPLLLEVIEAREMRQFPDSFS